ncbi:MULTISPECIES: radical SAM protein [Empedobacter]|uniref:radical SAM protein n=1 Tax=Empedobacter TaxID=59734 RepID=UPI002576EDCE|nr:MULTISPECIES: radical SAM protein [Empedobacter]MDM1041010.1 radical SAM protein [Empedobacter brevis]MDM1134591.1 radical SAM protein [Empedobacter sp. R750]
MNVYKLLKLNWLIKNHRIKFLGMYLLHKTNQRYIAVNFDPVMACNLRCKMCYFTDENYVKKTKGIFPKEDLSILADKMFGRALKLQIGCGTEPTLYKDLAQIVSLGKAHKVPYISLTTNANLLTKEKVKELVDNGLNEFTISLHGVHQEAYENFMGKASFDKFHEALQAIYEEKKNNPNLILRINYTFNKDNFLELMDFFAMYGQYEPNILQIRPMKSMGDTEYQDTDISSLKDSYDAVLKEIKTESKNREMTLLATSTYDELVNATNVESLVYNYTYCYIRPGYTWKDEFDYKKDTFNDFSKKIGLSKELLRNAFSSKKQMDKLKTKTSLNYNIIE